VPERCAVDWDVDTADQAALKAPMVGLPHDDLKADRLAAFDDAGEATVLNDVSVEHESSAYSCVAPTSCRSTAVLPPER
jgi:hypothetical protein